MPDLLEIELRNVWDRYIRRAEEMARLGGDCVSAREDAFLAFVRQVRETISRSGFVSGEKYFNGCMAAKKSGYEDGVKYEKHKLMEAMTATRVILYEMKRQGYPEFQGQNYVDFISSLGAKAAAYDRRFKSNGDVGDR